MSIIIREATFDDLDSIYLLNKNEMGYDYLPEKTAFNLRKILSSQSNKIFVAETDGKVVGYVHASDYDLLYFPHMKNIMGIAVNREYRREGVGRALINEIEKWASVTGASSIRIASGIERKEAHDFYRSCGYIENKIQQKFMKNIKELKSI